MIGTDGDLVIKPENAVVFAGMPHKLSCQTNELKVLWYYSSSGNNTQWQILYTGNKIVDIFLSLYSTETDLNGKKVDLIINHTKPEYSGAYRCKDPRSDDEAIAQLIIGRNF